MKKGPKSLARLTMLKPHQKCIKPLDKYFIHFCKRGFSIIRNPEIQNIDLPFFLPDIIFYLSFLSLHYIF